LAFLLLISSRTICLSMIVFCFPEISRL
jgi:hypothetical protein